jgi:hypothetical protein
MSKKPTVCTIYLSAPTLEALEQAVAATSAKPGSKALGWEIISRPDLQGEWVARATLLVKAKQPKEQVSRTDDDRINLLLIAGIGVLCALNLIVLKMLCNISPLDGLNFGIVGFIALGLAWHCVKRASRLVKKPTASPCEPEPVLENATKTDSEREKPRPSEQIVQG